MRAILTTTVGVVLCSPLLLMAQQSVLTSEQQREVVQAVGAALAGQYVVEGEGQRLARALLEQVQRGRFAQVTDLAAFAAALEQFMQGETKDRHLLVWPGGPIDILKRGTALNGPSIGRTELLPGGVGYVEVRHFLSASQGNALSGAQIDAAIAAVTGASALIFDVRTNVGGDLASAARLAGYLFEGRTLVLGRSLRGRSEPLEVWTPADLPGARMPRVPVYVLTSAGTFSAGEAFAFALKQTGRAVIVGETTGGGGYSGTFARLPHGLTMFVSTGRTYDPRTGKGWQVEGVRPDRDVPEAQALETALELARHR